MWISKDDYRELVAGFNELDAIKAVFGNPPKDTSTVNYMQVLFDNKERERMEWYKRAHELIEKLNSRIDLSIKDPLFQQIRILLPEELEEIKKIALRQVVEDPYGSHSECWKTLLLVMRTFTEEEVLKITK